MREKLLIAMENRNLVSIQIGEFKIDGNMQILSYYDYDDEIKIDIDNSGDADISITIPICQIEDVILDKDGDYFSLIMKSAA